MGNVDLRKGTFRRVPIHGIHPTLSIVVCLFLVILQCEVSWARWCYFIVIGGASDIRMFRHWSGCVSETVLGTRCGWVPVCLCLMQMWRRELRSVWFVKFGF